jgi:hypothetical protein
VRPEHQELADGVKWAAIATVSAVLTATVVIGAGRTLMPPSDIVAADRLPLTQAILRQSPPLP